MVCTFVKMMEGICAPANPCILVPTDRLVINVVLIPKLSPTRKAASYSLYGYQVLTDSAAPATQRFEIKNADLACDISTQKYIKGALRLLVWKELGVQYGDVHMRIDTNFTNTVNIIRSIFGETSSKYACEFNYQTFTCSHDDYLRELKGKLSAMSVLLQPPPPLLPSIRSTVDQATGNPVEGSLSTGYVQPPMQPVTLVMNSQFVSSAYPVMMYPPMKNAFAVRAVPQNAFAVQAVPQMQNIPINGGDHLPQVPLGGSAYQHGANHTNAENMGTTNVGAMKMGTMNMGTMNVGTMNVGTMNVGRSSASPPQHANSSISGKRVAPPNAYTQVSSGTATPHNKRVRTEPAVARQTSNARRVQLNMPSPYGQERHNTSAGLHAVDEFGVDTWHDPFWDVAGEDFGNQSGNYGGIGDAGYNENSACTGYWQSGEEEDIEEGENENGYDPLLNECEGYDPLAEPQDLSML